MMMKFAKLLRSKATAADLGAAGDAAAEALAEAQRKLADLTARREALLLDGDDAALDALEDAIRRARREVERCEAAQAALVKKAAEARDREVAEALDRRLKAADAALAEGRKLIGRYAELAEELADVLRRLDAIEAQRAEAQQAASAAGRDWRREPAEKTALEPGKPFRRIGPLVKLPDERRPFGFWRYNKEHPPRPAATEEGEAA